MTTILKQSWETRGTCYCGCEFIYSNKDIFFRTEELTRQIDPHFQGIEAKDIMRVSYVTCPECNRHVKVFSTLIESLEA